MPSSSYMLHSGRLLLATHNQGKLAEFRQALKDQDIMIVSASEYNLPEPEETGDSFEANATLKASAAARATGLPALADDSGLAVAGLNGAPGIKSARWAGPGKDFTAAFERLKTELAARGHAPQGAAAAFVCVLVAAWPDGHVKSAKGQVTGHLTFPPRGEAGFGYDPIFVPEGEHRTFAEMTAAEKGGFSHRMRALAALRPLIFTP